MVIDCHRIKCVLVCTKSNVHILYNMWKNIYMDPTWPHVSRELMKTTQLQLQLGNKDAISILILAAGVAQGTAVCVGLSATSVQSTMSAALLACSTAEYCCKTEHMLKSVFWWKSSKTHTHTHTLSSCVDVPSHGVQPVCADTSSISYLNVETAGRSVAQPPLPSHYKHTRQLFLAFKDHVFFSTCQTPFHLHKR